MDIKDDKDLLAACEEAGTLLQAIHEYCKDNNRTLADFPEARVRFPRGFIRTASYQRSRFPFLTDRNLKANISYTLILSDTILWLALRTDVFGTARDMLLKLFIFLVGSVIESTTKSYLKGKCGKVFCKRTEYMVTHGMITKDLKTELDWVWSVRNRMHLFQLEGKEWTNDYDFQTHSRCIAAFRGLLSSLVEYESGN